jgi:hypothetical protein
MKNHFKLNSLKIKDTVLTAYYQTFAKNENSASIIQNKILTEQEIQTFPTFPTFIRDDSNKLSRPLIKSVVQQNYDPVYLKSNNYNNSMQNMISNEFAELKKEKLYNNTYTRLVKAGGLKTEIIDGQVLKKSKYLN